MARLRAVLTAVSLASQRRTRSIASVYGNNLFYLGITLLFFHDESAFQFSLVIIALVIFIPLSADPLRSVPPERMALWPFSTVDRWLLRLISPWLNPITWLLPVLMAWRRVSWGLWACVALVFLTGFGAPAGSRFRLWLPPLPGVLNHLIRKNIREFVCTLDFFAGLILAVPALVFRVAGRMPDEACFPMTMLIMIVISTHAQNLFGLESESGLLRYRLLPLRGWMLLFARDVAFLVVSAVLTLALSPLGGLASAMVALTTGRACSVKKRRAQKAWRFLTSPSFAASVVQMALMFVATAATMYRGPICLVPCGAAYLWSTFHFGRELESLPEVQ